MKTGMILVAPALLDWFWNLPAMRTLQGWADATRTLIDPLHAMAGLAVAILLVMWLLDRPASSRDTSLPGSNYLGKLTPKRLQSMLRSPPRKQLRSRSQMEAEIGRAAKRRRAAEGKDSADGES